jgi:hypothetical protein
MGESRGYSFLSLLTHYPEDGLPIAGWSDKVFEVLEAMEKGATVLAAIEGVEV